MWEAECERKKSMGRGTTTGKVRDERWRGGRGKGEEEEVGGVEGAREEAKREGSNEEGV